jgi:hypothetical protein
MTDGTRSDRSAGAGTPGEVVLRSAPPKAASEMGRTALPGTAPVVGRGCPQPTARLR